MAVKRSRSLVPRLCRDEERRKMIFKSVNKWEETGIAESVDELVDNQASEDKRPIWHLPLMAVDEPHKLRICHDAAASVGAST